MKEWIRSLGITGTVFVAGALSVDYHWWAGVLALLLLSAILQ